MHACANKHDCIISFPDDGICMDRPKHLKYIVIVMAINIKNVDPNAIIDSQFPILVCLLGLKVAIKLKGIMDSYKINPRWYKFTYP